MMASQQGELLDLSFFFLCTCKLFINNLFCGQFISFSSCICYVGPNVKLLILLKENTLISDKTVETGCHNRIYFTRFYFYIYVCLKINSHFQSNSG